MKRNYFLLFFFLIAIRCMSQIDSISQRVFLIGDAGELVGSTHPVVDWLKKNVNWDDEKNVAVFLGDNIYPMGLPMEGEAGYVGAKQIIDYQISLVKGKKGKGRWQTGIEGLIAKAIFIVSSTWKAQIVKKMKGIIGKKIGMTSFFEAN